MGEVVREGKDELQKGFDRLKQMEGFVNCGSRKGAGFSHSIDGVNTERTLGKDLGVG